MPAVGRLAGRLRRCTPLATVALTHAGRDGPLDPVQQRLEVVGQLRLGDVEFGGDHAAADVDTDG